MTKKIDIEVEVEIDVFDKSELVAELHERGFDFSEECDCELPSEEQETFLESIHQQNPQATKKVDDEIILRFYKCAHLLKWEQWNHILCKVEKMTNAERSEQPSKLDYL